MIVAKQNDLEKCYHDYPWRNSAIACQKKTKRHQTDPEIKFKVFATRTKIDEELRHNIRHAGNGFVRDHNWLYMVAILKRRARLRSRMANNGGIRANFSIRDEFQRMVAEPKVIVVKTRIDNPWGCRNDANKECNFYFCGPKPFMFSVYRDLTDWNIPLEQMHWECFGRAQSFEESAF